MAGEPLPALMERLSRIAAIASPPLARSELERLVRLELDGHAAIERLLAEGFLVEDDRGAVHTKRVFVGSS